MSKHTLLSSGLALLASSQTLLPQSLEKAEVTIPYSELKTLLTKAEPPAKPAPAKPVLLSARLCLSMENQQPVIEATFRAAGFGDTLEWLPLVSGAVSITRQDPADALVMARENSLCLALNQPGVRTLKLRLLPVMNQGGFSFSLPPCPSAALETGALADDQSILWKKPGANETLTPNACHPLPQTGADLTFQFLTREETLESRRPPEPSAWSWQHQALVMPQEDSLTYRLVARATAKNGSGTEAVLPMPADAHEVEINGDDLASHHITRNPDRSQSLALKWKTRGILDRKVRILYQMPLRPLDRVWKLQTPGENETLTRFIVTTTPRLAFEAKGLSEPLSPQGLPKELAAIVQNNPCRYLEAGNSAELAVRPVPIAPTAEGVATSASWQLRIEPDGAMLATGTIILEHKSMLEFSLDTPVGMKLLSCELNGSAVSPVDAGGGNLKITIPAQSSASKISCRFTGSTQPLDPVEGTLTLSLPKTPTFTHALQWQIELPEGYQAETQGNLKPAAVTNGPAPWKIGLCKNLCRDERPQVQLFYQRSDLNR